MRYDNILYAIGTWKIEEALELIEKLPADDYMRYPLLSLAYDKRDENEKAIACAEKGIELGKNSENLEIILASLASRAYTLWRTGENEKIDKTFSDFIAYYEVSKETPEHDRWYAMIQHVRGTILYEMGEYDESLKSFKIALYLRKELKDIIGQATSDNNLGLLYYNIGEYNRSLEHLMASVENEVILGNQKGLAITYSNIADVHRAVGEYDLALKFMNMALETHQKYPLSAHYEALIYKNLAKIYRLKGDSETAHSCIQHSLNLELPLENRYRLMETLYLMIIIDLERGERAEAELLLRTMKELGPFEKNTAISFFYRIAEASVVMSENRLRSKLKAQEMFEEILKDDPRNYDLYIHTVLSLVELLFLELQSYDNPELMNQVKLIVQQIETIANSQNSTPLQVEALLLKSQVSLVELKMNETFEILDKVKEICLENDFNMLYNKAEGIQKNLEEEIDKWNNLSHSNAPLFKRISESNIMDYLRMVGKIIN